MVLGYLSKRYFEGADLPDSFFRTPSRPGAIITIEAVTLGELTKSHTNKGNVKCHSVGGTFAANSKKVFWEPFTAETGIKIIEANYTLAKHKAMVESGQVEWDILAFLPLPRWASFSISMPSCRSTTARSKKASIPAPLPGNIMSASNITHQILRSTRSSFRQ
ncbi:hypothetical protein [Neorhizobium galegae]|uniref:hypothetical protein n=1 Tax=Neorhizobium galegae TaxID=399 RepID=UPI0020359CFC|nr:hypothetical protein [Neorhizobium galegae]MCM2498714.1 hypothetical protein [Neorhizobium galegae]